MPRPVQYADEARRDLVALAESSRAAWGAAHARAFFEGLERLIEQLRTTPEIGQAVPEIRPGLRRRVFQSLVIFYSVEQEAIRILAVLHGRQDAASILGDRI